MKHTQWIVTTTLALIFFLSANLAKADCANNGATFHVQLGETGCISIGAGNKVVHCVVSGLAQNANLLITASGFNPDSDYPYLNSKILLNYNEQRLTFSGVGDPNAQINFAYYGPWDPSYSYDLTCTW